MSKRSIKPLTTAIVGLTLCASAATAATPTVNVANNGVDNATCGTEAAPCRTINQGLSQLPRGGNLLVHPGIYGDVDGDGVVDGSDEDEAPANASDMIVINRKITVKSVAGPASTVIRCPDPGPYRVTISNVPASFGTKVNGFTLLDCTILVVGGSQSPSVAGNRIIATANGDPAIWVESGVNPRITNNHCIGHARGIYLSSATDSVLSGNVVVDNSVGIEDHASGTVLSGNVVVGNTEQGVILAGDASPLPIVVERNSIIGNGTSRTGDGGIRNVSNPADLVITDNNIFGNDEPGDNCGIFDDEGSLASVPLVATGNFWGAPTGPGPNPADVVCSVLTADTSGFLDSEVRARPKAMK